MAESKWLDLAQSVMIERYDLDEMTYRLESFSEGSKAVSLKMSDGFIPVTAKFPIEFLEMESIRRMTDNEKRAKFMFYAPQWHKLPGEFRQLFDGIVDDWETIDEIPELVDPRIDEDAPEVVLAEEEEYEEEEEEEDNTPTLTVKVGKTESKIPMKRKVSARKPVSKKK